MFFSEKGCTGSGPMDATIAMQRVGKQRGAVQRISGWLVDPKSIQDSGSEVSRVWFPKHLPDTMMAFGVTSMLFHFSHWPSNLCQLE